MEETREDFEKALATLREGGVILYPTDTIWGLGCDATNTESVERIFRIKGRANSKAMISLVGSEEQLEAWIGKIPARALEEIRDTGRPLTIIYDSPAGISRLLKANDGSAAFRITGLDYTARLCEALGRPIVSTSANISGEEAPKTFGEIKEQIISRVDYVCKNGREISGNLPSRILKITDEGNVTVIRE